MKKTEIKKLSISKSTLHHLSQVSLKQINGATGRPSCRITHCQSICDGCYTEECTP